MRKEFVEYGDIRVDVMRLLARAQGNIGKVRAPTDRQADLIQEAQEFLGRAF